MRIVAFDLDGTLLFPTGIDDDVLQAIRDWQGAGHLAVAATGKSRAALAHAIAPYDLSFDYSVLFTGAAVTDRDGRYIFSDTIPSAAVREIITPLIDDPTIAVYGTTLHGRDALLSRQPAELGESTILRDFIRLPADEIDRHEFVGLPIWVPGDPARQLRLRDQITSAFPDIGVQINQNFIDVIPAGADKGRGLRQVIADLDATRPEVELITFGDAWNDLPMHSIADRSYSFPWSPEEVVAGTDAVIDSVAVQLPRLM